MAVVDDRGAPPSSEYDRQPPQDIAAEQCVLGGMLLSKDAIADVVEVLAGRRLLPAGARDDLRRRSSTSTAAASRPTRSPSSAELTRSGRARAGRRRALPAHPDLLGADRGQRRLLRRDRRRAGGAAPAGRGRHPDRPARLRRGRRRATSTTSSTGPRPRSTRSPSGATSEDYVRLEQLLQGRSTRSRPSRLAAAAMTRRAHRLRRARRAHQRPAPGPDGRSSPPGPASASRRSALDFARSALDQARHGVGASSPWR